MSSREADTNTVYVDGVGMTRFRGSTEDTLADLMGTAADRALDDSTSEGRDVESIHVGNMAAEGFNGRSGLQNLLAPKLGLTGVFADRVENTSASGASAFLRGVDAVASGRSDSALVVGVEKMSDAETDEATGIIGSIVHQREHNHGLTLPSFGGLVASEYQRRYEPEGDGIGAVAVKNHENGAKNPYAHFQNPVSLETVQDSRPIADPLRLYDISPMSDGSAAVLLTSTPRDGAVRVAGSASAVGTHAIADRSDPLEIESVEIAGTSAFEQAGIDHEDVDVLSLHDAFTILEVVELEGLGFYEPGDAWRATVEGETAIQGELPVNPGGGLKARGHPLGATGLAQIIEIVWQLRGEASGRQVADASVGMTLNVAGFGNNAITTVLTEVNADA